MMYLKPPTPLTGIKTKEECLERIAADGNNFLVMPHDFQNDIDIVREAITSNYPVAFYDLPEKFKNDKELALLAAQQPDIRINDFPDGFQQDIDIVTACIKANAADYMKSNLIFQSNKDLLLLAIQGTHHRAQMTINVLAGKLNNIILDTVFEEGAKPAPPSTTQSTKDELITLTQYLIAVDTRMAMKKDRQEYLEKKGLAEQGTEPVRKTKFRPAL